MTFESAFFNFLISDPGVAGLTDAGNGGYRIYPVRLPEGAGGSPMQPCIAWNRISSNRIPTYDKQPDYDAWVKARIQIDCFAKTYDEARDLGEAVMLLLSGFDGDMSGQMIGSSEAVNEFDTYEGTTKIYRRTMDFMIAYEEHLEPTS